MPQTPSFEAPMPRLEGFYARLEQALRQAGIKQRDLATEAGIREAAISSGLNGRGGLDTHKDAIAAVLARHGVDKQWLMWGDEPSTANTPSGGQQALRPEPPTQPAFRELGTLTDRLTFSQAQPGHYRTIPADAVLLVQDNSMAPLIRGGQFALLAPEDRQPRDGDIVFLRTVGGDAYLRRYRDAGTMVILEAINQGREYATIVVPQDAVARVLVVIGVAFE